MFAPTPFAQKVLAAYEAHDKGNAEEETACWEALERGEMTKPEVLVGRFHRFFAQEGITCSDVKAFNDSYQRKLGEIFFENEDSVALCKKLHGKICQCVITNGTVEAQREKLRAPALDNIWMGFLFQMRSEWKNQTSDFSGRYWNC